MIRNTHVRLIISDLARGPSQLDTGITERATKREASTAESVLTNRAGQRAALASIPGSLAQDMIVRREEY